MEKINQNPENKVSKLEQEKGELAIMPIFRNNDLYQAMFPEIKPLFEKGEEVNKTSIKKVVDAIIANENKAVIVDGTCGRTLSHIKLEHLPEKFGLKELPTMNGGFDLNAFKGLLKTHYNIDFDPYNTLEQKLREKIGDKFSPELAKELFEIAKKKNQNIKEVYILTLNLADHVQYPLEIPALAEYKDMANEISEGITETDNTDAEGIKDEKERMSYVAAVLVKTVESELGVKAKLVSTLNQENLKEGDLLVLDRHNLAMRKGKINESFPKQVSILPLETELYNNEQFLGNELPSEGLANMLRKNFEKTST